METSVLIPGPVGHLEAMSLQVDSAKNIIAVICHPHPLHGGSLQNKVVATISRALRDLGIPSVRFNFRGVGSSEGEYDNGVGEVDDLLAVIDWVLQQYPQHELWLAGFSFGSYVVFTAASKRVTQRLILVAPPVHHFDYQQNELPDCPWLIIQPEADEIVPPQEVYAWIDNLPIEPTLVKIPEADHLFHGKLLVLRDVLTENLSV